MASPDRYHRQTLLPGIGAEGQARLKQSHALIVGCGALGCASADLLCRAGVGTLTIVDRDLVEWTNLQRQCLFDERDAAERAPKADAARRRLGAVNSEVRVNAIVADFTHRNAEAIIRGTHAANRTDEAPPRPVHVLIDGTDNFQTRYLLNDLSIKFGIPYCYAGVVGTRGMQMTVLPGTTACLRCLFPEPPAPGTTETCDTAGVLGPAVQISAACQAADAMKVLLGRSDLIAPTLLEFDLWTTQRRRIDLSSFTDAAARRDCPCCGTRDFAYLEGRAADDAATLCGQGAVQVAPAACSVDAPGTAGPDLNALAARLRAHGRVEVNRFLVRASLDHEHAEHGPVELTVFADGRAIVRGTTRADTARSIVSRYVGA